VAGVNETESVGWGRLALLLGVIAFAAIGFLGSLVGEPTAVAQTGPTTTCDPAYGCTSSTSGASTTTIDDSSTTTIDDSSTTTACPAFDLDLVVSDNTVSVGQVITLTASGPPAGNEIVFRFDGGIIGRVTTGANSQASMQFTIPAGADQTQTHTVSAEVRLCTGVVDVVELEIQVTGDAVGGFQAERDDGGVAGFDAGRGDGGVAGGALARTGANILGLILLAIVLLLLGRTLQLEAKRRRARAAAMPTF
jgi:hypothetical protein